MINAAESNVMGCGSCVSPPISERLVRPGEIRLSEIVSGLSVALDITQGNAQGHCMRTALVGMRLAEELRLPAADCSSLFYALLLKDLGCSSNAAKIAYLFGADDRSVKQSARLIDWTKARETFGHCWNQCAPGRSTVEKVMKVAAIARLGTEGGRKIAEIRCERGANIARMLQLPEATAAAIYDLDEHWNGRGNPRGVHGTQISMLGRICCLAQTVEVFFSVHGLGAAIDVAEARRGEWFDPELVDALTAFKRDASFWSRLKSCDLMSELSRWEPEDAIVLADETCLDRVAEAFASVVDAKSPWTYQHSTRVAEIAVGVARQFGCVADVERDLRRAALLHDIGKLGVSNLILDKPGAPTAAEFVQIRRHPDYTKQILERVGALQALADVASAHHERLDGNGYHRRLDGTGLPWLARILTVADIAEAMSARRPYREAWPWEKIREVMRKEAGAGVDHDCLHALEQWHDQHQLQSRVVSQLREVDRMMSEL
jgi:putative nucleotidyltransferase with HDIG domain